MAQSEEKGEERRAVECAPCGGGQEPRRPRTRFERVAGKETKESPRGDSGNEGIMEALQVRGAWRTQEVLRGGWTLPV